MGLIERLWRLLPDKCDLPDCTRQGVRGNENRIAGRLVCDNWHAGMMPPYRQEPIPPEVAYRHYRKLAERR